MITTLKTSLPAVSSGTRKIRATLHCYQAARDRDRQAEDREVDEVPIKMIVAEGAESGFCPPWVQEAIEGYSCLCYTGLDNLHPFLDGRG